MTILYKIYLLLNYVYDTNNELHYITRLNKNDLSSKVAKLVTTLKIIKF